MTHLIDDILKTPWTSEPVAWRCRWHDEQDWKYFDKPLAKRDLARKMPGFEEQPLWARGLTVSVKDGSAAS